MNKLEHTPGPWKYSHKIAYGHDIMQDCDEHVWIGNANNTDDRSKLECESNARLIAAAPEMLSQIISDCKEYKRCIDQEVWEDEFQEADIREGFATRKVIIEKATGKKIEEVL